MGPALVDSDAVCNSFPMALSQVQIIRSLAEALAWFEKELSWKVEPAELRHLTGRIGELYAAMITRGQMALEVNQKGYDVVSLAGEHISVKTITSSSHVRFNKNSFDEVHRVMVLRINIDDCEASIEEIFDGPKSEMVALCKDHGTDLDFYVLRKPKHTAPIGDIKIIAEATIDNKKVIQLENGTIVVEVKGMRQPIVKPILREICEELRISLLNSNNNYRNTRQLGAEIIATLNA